ncbi:MAG: DUF1207 domain-containing protein [Thermoanaerobaculia bacterium]|nr:DUF1207 domain-containing protein [Thermoanaerobaculia bacterium]
MLADAPGPESGWDLFPAVTPYPAYLADPLRVAFGVSVLDYSTSEIPGTGDQRFALKLGGTFPVVAFHPPEAPRRPWVLSVLAGFNGQFDLDHNQDNVGWDGIYGLQLAHRLSDRWAVKVGIHHTSSHIGDELQERSGRERIDYTREEVRVGMSWKPLRRWRLYGEGAYGYKESTIDEALQEPGRAQLGTEVYLPLPESDAWDTYLALDLNSFQERDWEIDVSAQAGIRQIDGPWRLALTWMSGRTPIGEFFFRDETYLGLGVWYDLGAFRGPSIDFEP